MSANFTGVTFPNQKVTPANDAVIRRAIFDDGILTGCDLSYSGSTLTMTAGQLMICGRQIIHPSSQNWAVTEATSGYARLVLTIDVTRTSTKDTFDQVVDEIQYATDANGFADLTTADINATGTRYQVAVCVVSLGPGGITGIASKLDVTEGGGAGGNLKVIALAGVAVTVTKGSKVKQKVADAAGVAMFTGLETGTWTVTLPADVSPPTRTVDIDVDYVVVIAYFSATINVTYPSGSTCTATDGTTTLTAPDTSGTWACVVPNVGTWTVAATDGNDSTNKSVSITADGQTENVVLSYTLVLYEKNGETVDWSYKAYDYSVPSVNMTLDTLKSQYGEGNARRPTLYTTAKHDISSYDTLFGSFDMQGSGGIYLGILSSPPTNGSEVDKVGFVSRANGSGAKVNLTLDISGFTGEYYIAVYVTANWASHYDGSTIKIYAE